MKRPACSAGSARRSTHGAAEGGDDDPAEQQQRSEPASDVEQRRERARAATSRERIGGGGRADRAASSLEAQRGRAGCAARMALRLDGTSRRSAGMPKTQRQSDLEGGERRPAPARVRVYDERLRAADGRVRGRDGGRTACSLLHHEVDELAGDDDDLHDGLACDARSDFFVGERGGLDGCLVAARRGRLTTLTSLPLTCTGISISIFARELRIGHGPGLRGRRRLCSPSLLPQLGGEEGREGREQQDEGAEDFGDCGAAGRRRRRWRLRRPRAR